MVVYSGNYHCRGWLVWERVASSLLLDSERLTPSRININTPTQRQKSRNKSQERAKAFTACLVCPLLSTVYNLIHTQNRLPCPDMRLPPPAPRTRTPLSYYQPVHNGNTPPKANNKDTQGKSVVDNVYTRHLRRTPAALNRRKLRAARLQAALQQQHVNDERLAAPTAEETTPKNNSSNKTPVTPQHQQQQQQVHPKPSPLRNRQESWTSVATQKQGNNAESLRLSRLADYELTSPSLPKTHRRGSSQGDVPLHHETRTYVSSASESSASGASSSSTRNSGDFQRDVSSRGDLSSVILQPQQQQWFPTDPMLLSPSKSSAALLDDDDDDDDSPPPSPLRQQHQHTPLPRPPTDGLHDILGQDDNMEDLDALIAETSLRWRTSLTEVVENTTTRKYQLQQQQQQHPQTTNSSLVPSTSVLPYPSHLIIQQQQAEIEALKARLLGAPVVTTTTTTNEPPVEQIDDIPVESIEVHMDEVSRLHDPDDLTVWSGWTQQQQQRPPTPTRPEADEASTSRALVQQPQHHHQQPRMVKDYRLSLAAANGVVRQALYTGPTTAPTNNNNNTNTPIARHHVTGTGVLQFLSGSGSSNHATDVYRGQVVQGEMHGRGTFCFGGQQQRVLRGVFEHNVYIGSV